MKSSILRLFSIALSTTLLSLLIGVRPAHAAGIVVSTNVDTFDVGSSFNCGNVTISDLPGGGDGKISLREAMCAANNTAGADTITFDADYTITLSGSELPEVTSEITITGNDPAKTIIRASSCNPVTTVDDDTLASGCTPVTNRVFEVGSSGNLTLESLTVKNGKCIYSSDCPHFQGVGAGVYNNHGILAVANSAFSGNSAIDDGGGIYNNYGTLTVTNSTFSGNSAVNGGGIYNFTTSGGCGNASAATIANSTFSGNLVNSRGGGIHNDSGVITLLFNTITANSEGVYSNNDLSCTKAGSNIIAGNTGHDVEAGPTISYRYDSLDYNLIGTRNSKVDFTLEFNATHDQTGVTDPMLGPLADNGGPTFTHALLSGSPAIDAGPTTCATAPIDQRGVTRPQGTACDIGAYEYGPVIPLVTSTTPSANATVSSPSTITVTFNQDMLNDSSAKAANTIANYLLVERGTNNVFDTQSCAGGLQSDDVQQTISNASYTNNGGSGPFTATLTLASPLANGNYQLFICGTTSIWSVAGLELNDGANDTTVDFTVGATGGGGNGGNGTAYTLPTTGFAPGMTTILPAQPEDKAYSSTDLTLEIPSLGVKTPIVGVPRSGDSWDVTWLGTEAGWLNGSAYPTWAGNTVLTGHVWNADNTPGIFVNLKQLNYGDQIKIEAYGQTYTYEVRQSRLVWPDQTNIVLQHEKYDWVTLLTCEDYNILFAKYPLRRMVRAVLISVK